MSERWPPKLISIFSISCNCEFRFKLTCCNLAVISQLDGNERFEVIFQVGRSASNAPEAANKLGRALDAGHFDSTRN